MVSHWNHKQRIKPSLCNGPACCDLGQSSTAPLLPSLAHCCSSTSLPVQLGHRNTLCAKSSCTWLSLCLEDSCSRLYCLPHSFLSIIGRKISSSDRSFLTSLLYIIPQFLSPYYNLCLSLLDIRLNIPLFIFLSSPIVYILHGLELCSLLCKEQCVEHTRGTHNYRMNAWINSTITICLLYIFCSIYSCISKFSGSICKNRRFFSAVSCLPSV